MARKRYSDEDVLNLLRQVELSLASGSSVETACRSAGISDATYYNWRKRYGGMGKSQLQEFKSLGKENSRLKMIVADLELDKLILKESLDYRSVTGSGSVSTTRTVLSSGCAPGIRTISGVWTSSMTSWPAVGPTRC